MFHYLYFLSGREPKDTLIFIHFSPHWTLFKLSPVMVKRGESSHSSLKLHSEFHKNKTWQWSPAGPQELLWSSYFPSLTNPDLLTGLFLLHTTQHINTLWINKEKKARFFFRVTRFLKAKMSQIYLGVFESLYTKQYEQKLANKSHFAKAHLFHFTLYFFISPFHDLLSVFSDHRLLLIHTSAFQILSSILTLGENLRKCDCVHQVLGS